MIDGLFPSGTFTATTRQFESPPQLFPVEEDSVALAVPSRRNEFALGRHCARRALGNMGIEKVALPVGLDRVPVWPTGVTGSITHCPGFVGAVVGPTSEFACLGLDAEPTTPLDEDLLSVVCTPRELRHLHSSDLEMRLAGKLLFCIKEAVFKAVFPRHGIWLEFADVEVVLEANSTFRVTRWARPEGGGGLPDSTRLSGRYLVTPDHFFSGVALAPLPPLA